MIATKKHKRLGTVVEADPSPSGRRFYERGCQEQILLRRPAAE
jgi:hypothetical protein